MKPKNILIFLLLTGLFLLPTVFLLPKDGLKIGPFEITMMSWDKIMGRDSLHRADISDIVDIAQHVDSLPDVLDQVLSDSTQNSQQDSSVKIKPIVIDPNTHIHPLDHNEAGKKNLQTFFTQLLEGVAQKKRVRVMHYGDSQIEGDRITSYIRNKLQKRFGGFGVGLLPARQPYESFFSITQSNTGTWYRYTTFGKKDARVQHNQYGFLAAFSRFSPLIADSIPLPDSTLYEASIKLEKSNVAYAGVRKFKRLEILYGNARKATYLEIRQGEKVITSDSLKADVDYAKYSYTFPDYVNNVEVFFRGQHSPDIYAIDLGDTHGMAVDNVGMRGSSGTFFTRMDASHLAKMYADQNIEMLILQYGGNVMPYIKDSAAVESYGRWFGSQLRLLKKIIPGISIVVIGPSDMSYKDGENYVTYDFLPLVRDALKNATLSNGFSYWDMYEAMGGYNSMPEWVKADPPLAGTDYTHFTPRGAKVIANMFYNALMVEMKENPKFQNTKVKSEKDKVESAKDKVVKELKSKSEIIEK
jgi:lysophospholipase L1-like esterase